VSLSPGILIGDQEETLETPDEDRNGCRHPCEVRIAGLQRVGATVVRLRCLAWPGGARITRRGSVGERPFGPRTGRRLLVRVIPNLLLSLLHQGHATRLIKPSEDSIEDIFDLRFCRHGPNFDSHRTSWADSVDLKRRDFERATTVRDLSELREATDVFK